MRNQLVHICILAYVAASAAASDYGPYPVTVTAGQAARQEWEGFGYSMVSGNIMNKTEFGSIRDQVFTHLVDELHANTIRLWWSETNPTDPTKADLTFDEKYVQTELAAEFRKRGIKNFLLAPGGARSNVSNEQAMEVAEFIRDLHKNGTQIDVTGIANEPGAITPQNVSTMVQIIHQNLSAFGLPDVEIVAPEWASQDGTGLAHVLGCKNSTGCWRDLYGIAGHSYNMAATQTWANETLNAEGEQDKKYWVTEAGGFSDGFEFHGASLAARLLNDLNHRVTTWVWFIGVEDHDPRHGQDEMRLIITWKNGTTPNLTEVAGTSMTRGRRALRNQEEVDAAAAAGWPLYTLTPGFHYARQIANVLDLGATMRQSLANATYGAGGGDQMTWTYGKKEGFNVGVGRNGDGTWGIAIVNPTGMANGTISSSPAPTSYTIQVRVPELAQGTVSLGDSQAATAGGSGSPTGTPVVFDAWRSLGQSSFEVPEGPYIMEDGVVTVTIGSNSLVTLRSRSA